MIQATIIGRLGSDPEKKQVGQGTVTEFRIATTTKRGQNEITTWVRCSIWGKRGEAFARFHSKGSRAFVTGELVNREFQTKDGGRGYSLELDVSGWAFADSADGGGAKRSKPQATSPASRADDGIPF